MIHLFHPLKSCLWIYSMLNRKHTVGSIYFSHSDTPFCLCIRLFNPFTFLKLYILYSISHLCILFSVYIMPQLLPLNSSTMNLTAYWTLLLWLTDTSMIIINTSKTELPFFSKVCWSLFIYSKLVSYIQGSIHPSQESGNFPQILLPSLFTLNCSESWPFFK